ncbi:MAG: tRNA pseudouridine(55) synthase TruB, partial [Oscillospiraceae bacterium]
LDPMATGVLCCLMGKATKLCNLFPSEEKEYIGNITFGITSDTQDIWGKLSERIETHVTQKDLEDCLESFRGEISQLPPMFSAISIDGVKLYDLARQGKEIPREERKITINKLELLEFSQEKQEAVIKINCSKGTYIRTLIYDIGRALGVGAVMSGLRRTMANGFSLESCYTLEAVEKLFKFGDPQSELPDIYTAFEALPKIQTGEWQKTMLGNGVALNRDKFDNPPNGSCTIWCGEEFLGVYAFGDGEENIKAILRG